MTNHRCKLCEGIIILEIDSYVKVEDFKEGKFFSVGYFHNKCYNDALGDKRNKLLDRAEGLLNKAYSMVGGSNDDKQYVEVV